MTDFRIDKPGIYTEVALSDYFADPCPTPSLTQSVAKILLDRSPAHARLAHPRLTPPTPDDEPEKYDAAKAIGNAAHLIMLGRGRDLAIGPWQDWRTKEAQAFRRDNDAAGKTTILEKHHDRAREMTIATSYQLEALGLRNAFRLGSGEVMVAAEVDGVWLRCLVDWMIDTTRLFDFKTTGLSCAPHAIDHKMMTDDWPVQAAMQERCLDAVDPANAGRRKFIFVAQENEAPFALTAVELPESVMVMGRKRLAVAEMMWRQCLATGRWPAYPPTIHIAHYPGWAESRWLEREVAFHENRPRQREPMLTDLAGA